RGRAWCVWPGPGPRVRSCPRGEPRREWCRDARAIRPEAIGRARQAYLAHVNRGHLAAPRECAAATPLRRLWHDSSMPVDVAFLRGINVGRHDEVSMADLKQVVEGSGTKTAGRPCGAATSCSPRRQATR